MTALYLFGAYVGAGLLILWAVSRKAANAAKPSHAARNKVPKPSHAARNKALALTNKNMLSE